VKAKQDELRLQLSTLNEQHAAAAALVAQPRRRTLLPSRLLDKVRRRLSPGIVGKAWQLAKRRTWFAQ
jgi:hypothetical protein